MKSMTFRTVSRIHITGHGREPPSDDEWNAYLQDIKDRIREIDALIVFTLGGAPTAAQRETIAKFWSGEARRPRIAVLTPSVFVRTIVTALSWAVGQQIKAFSADDVDRAFGYLSLTLAQRRSVAEELARLQSEVAEPTSSSAAG